MTSGEWIDKISDWVIILGVGVFFTIITVLFYLTGKYMGVM